MRYRRVKTLPAKRKARRRPHAKRIPSTGGCFRLTDELWARLAPLLPVHENTHPLGRRTAPRARPSLRRSRFLRAADWLPVERAFGHRPGCRQFDRARPFSGVGGGRLLFALLAGRTWRLTTHSEASIGQWMSMDGAMTKAPLAGEKNRPQPGGPQQAPAPNARCSWRLAACLSACRWPEPTATTSSCSPKPSRAFPSPGPSPPNAIRSTSALDKGYDYEEVRAILQAYGFVAHIRSRGEEAARPRKRSLVRKPAVGWSSAPTPGATAFGAS